MRWSKFRGDEDVFEIDCANILADAELIAYATVKVEKITLGGFTDTTSEILWAHGPTRGTAYRCVFRDSESMTQAEGQYRVRAQLFTTLGRR